ncbi:MAG TPA: glycosyltransferase family 2 protein, partial [Armatimonadota bacterium]|nr:glycosyltransferase family 2 protein [Armatimonadota bacterium]
PTLSVIVPACNEEETVEPAMRSLLGLDYPGLEIVAVDDRSTDRTGEILERLAAENTRLRVLHLCELPPGWLGKNHALLRGSEQASGEWLLFTDADVHFAPDSLRRAAAVARSQQCDHLVAFPRVVTETFWERSFVSLFLVLFNFRFRCWQASWKWAPGYTGVGAFNMVRAEAYRRVGGHAPLRMEVADDVKLGKLMKRSGFRACLVLAEELIHVRWAVGLRGCIQVLTKNAFAGVSYSWVSLAGSILSLVVAGWWPVIGLFVGPMVPRLLCGATLLAMLFLATFLRPGSRVPGWYALTWPLSAVLFCYILVRSAWLAERQGGIYWRGTFYSLSELRKHLT